MNSSSIKYFLETGAEVKTGDVVIWKHMIGGAWVQTTLYKITNLEDYDYYYTVVGATVSRHMLEHLGHGDCDKKTSVTRILENTKDDFVIPDGIIAKGLEATRLHMALAHEIDTTYWEWDDELFPSA